jgi:hypothetical protein
VSAAFDPVDIERRVDESLSRSGAALKRSSLCTLVVVHPRALQTTVATRLDRLFGRRPLRVVRLETGYDAPTAVDVSARCLPHRDGDEVCFQEIVFYCGPDSRGREDALWAPLVIRDLPVLLWLDDPAALAARNETAPAVDKILIDLKTITGADAPAALRVLALLAGRFQGTIGTETPILADLAWRALTQARLAIARLFDGPETRPFLSRLTRVEFSISSAVDALLLALWLAARLGWKAGTLQGDEPRLCAWRGRRIAGSPSLSGPRTISPSAWSGTPGSIRPAARSAWSLKSISSPLIPCMANSSPLPPVWRERFDCREDAPALRSQGFSRRGGAPCVRPYARMPARHRLMRACALRRRHAPAGL